MKKIYSCIMTLNILLYVLSPTIGHAKVVIKLGTIAPEGSAWHDALLRLSQQWRDISDGELQVIIYAGGVLGDETEMVRKLQRRGLDAVAISGAGLPQIDNSIDCLNIPMLFDSYEALDYVRGAITVDLQEHLKYRQIKVLNWAEAGWVYFFTKQPVRTPDDLRELRLWTAAGYPETERLFKQFGFRVVPLASTDMLTALQTGLIEAIDVPPLFALLDRSYQVASYMTDLKWAPLNVATVIHLDVWQRVPEKYRQSLVEAASTIGEDLRDRIRRAEADAIMEMQARGLQVVAVDRATRDLWRNDVNKAYPELQCAKEHPHLFAKIMQVHAQFRKQTQVPEAAIRK